MKMRLFGSVPFVAVAFAASTLVSMAWADVPPAPTTLERCGGVAKAGKNDCGALDGSHGCANQAKKDHDPNEFVYVPKGTCAKLGGVAKGEKPAAMEQPAQEAGVWEQCGGVAKAGKNDCGALDGSHKCAGQASKDRNPNDWVFVPKGTCVKLGGVVKGEKRAMGSKGGD